MSDGGGRSGCARQRTGGGSGDRDRHPNAGIAQLVERNLAKVEVAGSSPVSRSKLQPRDDLGVFRLGTQQVSQSCPWLGGRVVMQRPAKPCTPVRFRPQPPFHVSSPQGPGGEIGRHKGLKIPRGQPCAGSSPAPGTTQQPALSRQYPLSALIQTRHSTVTCTTCVSSVQGVSETLWHKNIVQLFLWPSGISCGGNTCPS